jgi:hypothetical protein
MGQDKDKQTEAAIKIKEESYNQAMWLMHTLILNKKSGINDSTVDELLTYAKSYHPLSISSITKEELNILLSCQWARGCLYQSQPVDNTDENKIKYGLSFV